MTSKYDTNQQFQQIMAVCRDVFAKKLHDYGAAWRIMRPSSVTDQILIKANRIRSLETKGVSLVGEGIRPEFIAIVNYGIVGLIQLELGYNDRDDLTVEQALDYYDRYAKASLELMKAKNHDYGDSFNTTLNKYGPVASLVRMEDKLNRLSALLKDKAAIPEESVKDTLMDLANYSVMTLLWLETNKDNTSNTQWYG